MQFCSQHCACWWPSTKLFILARCDGLTIIRNKTIHVHLTEIISDMEHLLQFLDYESSVSPGIILCMRPANERRRYIVTPPVIGWAHTQNDPLRKSKDYVYGIWVYKVLGIWKGYHRVKKSLVSCMKPWTEAINYEYIKYPWSLAPYIQLPQGAN